MKKLLLTVALSALLLPTTSMASQTQQLLSTPQADESAVIPEVESSNIDEPMQKMKMRGNGEMKGKKKGKHGKKGKNRPDIGNMTDEEKSDFFNRRIEKMESHLDKMPASEMKTQKLEEVVQLKDMTLTEKESWFENNKKQMNKMKGDKKGKPDQKVKKGDKKPDIGNMTDEEKRVFFGKRIERMEDHLTKMPEGKKKTQKLEQIAQLKEMTLTETESWFENDKKQMNKKHKELKKLCKKIEKDDFNFDKEKSLSKIKSSSHYKNSSEDGKLEMIARLEKFSALSVDEQKERIMKKRNRLSSMCDKMEKGRGKGDRKGNSKGEEIKESLE